MHEVLVNRLGGLSLPRKSVVRFTDRPDMTLDVYRGRKTTIKQQIRNCARGIVHIYGEYTSNKYNIFVALDPHEMLNDLKWAINGEIIN